MVWGDFLKGSWRGSWGSREVLRGSWGGGRVLWESLGGLGGSRGGVLGRSWGRLGGIRCYKVFKGGCVKSRHTFSVHMGAMQASNIDPKSFENQ